MNGGCFQSPKIIYFRHPECLNRYSRNYDTSFDNSYKKLIKIKEEILSNQCTVDEKALNKILFINLSESISIQSFVYYDDAAGGDFKTFDSKTNAYLIQRIRQPVEEVIAALSSAEPNEQDQKDIEALRSVSNKLNDLFMSHARDHLRSNISPNALFMQMFLNKTIQEFKE
jgi:hypothetical protein